MGKFGEIKQIQSFKLTRIRHSKWLTERVKRQIGRFVVSLSCSSKARMATSWQAMNDEIPNDEEIPKHEIPK